MSQRKPQRRSSSWLVVQSHTAPSGASGGLGCVLCPLIHYRRFCPISGRLHQILIFTILNPNLSHSACRDCGEQIFRERSEVRNGPFVRLLWELSLKSVYGSLTDDVSLEYVYACALFASRTYESNMELDYIGMTYAEKR
jgi:hypothetical protein